MKKNAWKNFRFLLAQQNLECSFLYKKKYIKLHLPSSHSCEIQIMQNQVMW